MHSGVKARVSHLWARSIRSQGVLGSRRWLGRIGEPSRVGAAAMNFSTAGGADVAVVTCREAESGDGDRRLSVDDVGATDVPLIN
jgi:alkylation response protein AidB-like acyl-CoA dehydrogenase